MSLFDEMSNAEHIKKCWESVYANKSKEARRFSRGIDDVSLQEYQEKASTLLPDLSRKLRGGRFTFSPMKPIPKKKTVGYRVLSVPTVEDRIVHKAMLSVLTPKVFPYINTGVSYCGVKQDHWKKEENGVSIKRAMAKMISHVRNGGFFVFETDIKSFFAKVPKQKMISKISAVLSKDESLNAYIESVINYELGNTDDLTKRGIPLPEEGNGISQGSALSPIFANLYLADFDNAMKEKYGDRYIRYVDDLIVVCDTSEKAKQARKDVETFLNNEGLEISEDGNKTREVDLRDTKQRLDFLGIRTTRESLRPKKTNSEIRTWLNDKVLNKTQYEPRLSGGEYVSIGEQMNECIQGWGMYYRFYHVSEVFKLMDSFLQTRKKKDAALSVIEPLSNITLYPLIGVEEWRSFFRKK